MKITRVTLTGADDSIKPEQLFDISKKYPFVEWGLLASRNSQGLNRFPSKVWLYELSELNYDRELNLSCHLCGAYVREALVGNQAFRDELGPIWDHFKRVQINTHAQAHQYEKWAIETLKNLKKEIIFQYDGVNTEMVYYAIVKGVDCSILFDMSHGAGVLPKEWPMPIEGMKCGYAGGLSPENVTEQIKIIQSKVPRDYNLWIDMETKIRSNDDQLFDLDKCISVLESCLQTGLISIGK